MRTQLLPLCVALLVSSIPVVDCHGQIQPSGGLDVQQDAIQELQALIQTEFPGSSVRLRALNSSLILSGVVEDPAVQQQLVRVAEDYYPKVINNLQISNAEQIEEKQLRIVKLNSIESAQAVLTVKALFNEFLTAGLRIEANPERNLLIIRGAPELIDEIVELLAELDRMKPSWPSRNENSAGMANDTALATSSDSVEGQFSAAEQNIVQQRLDDLSQQYRSITSDQDSDPDVAAAAEAVLAEIKTVVEEAFDTRQRQQQDQVRRLQARLETLQQRIDQRHQDRQRVVDDVVRDLLAGKRRFISVAAQPSPSFQAPRDSQSVPHDAAEVGGDGLDALTLANELQELQNGLEHSKKLYKKGYLSAADLAVQQSRIKAAEGQLAALRHRYQTQIERLVLQYDQAKSELAFAQKEYDVADRTRQSSPGAIPESQLRKLAFNRDQAEFAVRRAELDLHAAKRQYDAFHKY